MKKKYITPECGVCEVETEDIIATSLGVSDNPDDSYIEDVDLDTRSVWDIWGRKK